MTREQLAAALASDNGAWAHEARTVLLAGADFAWLTEGRNTVSALKLWDLWSWRLEGLREAAGTPRTGMPEVVDRLRDAGDAQIHLAVIYGPDRARTVLLSADLAVSIACT
ncbi:hypothetical protein [Streptomyces sp. NPDC056785]|uniref:hypothetical protein n=1 Tax=Streptomyces sp. NPDC056785 TaxID=3345944 RepID=UPI00367DD4C5